ncbi:hypothetical protein ACUXV3_12390 [Roseobacteraceae bacterium NS-SX3]
MAKQPFPVTDHAVLRWLERFGFVDVEAVREQIYAETREALNSGATRLTINGTEYRMDKGVVVTLVDQRRPCRPLKWGRGK